MLPIDFGRVSVKYDRGHAPCIVSVTYGGGMSDFNRLTALFEVVTPEELVAIQEDDRALMDRLVEAHYWKVHSDPVAESLWPREAVEKPAKRKRGKRRGG